MDYDACVFFGARRKGQRIRHSLPELQQLPPLRCGHVHAVDEWKRTGMEFPTFAEAEYTPSLVFTLAVCATAWAIKHGYAVEAVPRLPPIQLSGDVRPLVQFPPQVLRSELMDAMGFHLGLKPPGVYSDFVPRREVASNRLSLGKTLESNEIYIGEGHFSHRWNPTMWSNPFKQGRHGNSFEIVLRYGQWVVDQDQLMRQLASLENCSLICDCATNQLCHGDILRALVWHEHRGHRGQGRATAQSSRTVALLAGGARIVKAIPLRFSQAEIVAAFTSLCVGIDMQDFRWPCIEDLINDDMVLCFRQSHQAEDWLGYDHGPVTVGPAERSIIALSGLQQLGTVSSSKALPPLIPFGLGADEHFRLSLEAQNHPTPFEEFGIVDKDLQFAADELSHHGLKLRAMRQHAVKWVQELGRRWQPVTDRLRRSQAKGPRAATQGRHLALIALLMILTGWPDPGFLACLLGGFPSVGYSPPLAVYQQQPAAFITLEEVLKDGFMDASALLATVLPSEFDEEIVRAGNEDEAKGFCASPMSWDELCSLQRPFRLIRRFCIRQPSGKLRVTDDASAGKQSELSSDSNKLDLCSALQPGLHAQLLWVAAQSCPDGGALLASGLESGGEDLPDAYRHVPMKPDEAWAAVVSYFDPQRGAPSFRLYYGELFGLPLAVTSFNRYPRFFQACLRRLGRVMGALYFDDLTIQDFGALRGSAQWFAIQLASCLGSPFAESKHQKMGPSADFLGLDHEVGHAIQRGALHFWVRPRLLQKVQDMINEALANERLLPGVASKLFGCLSFLNTGCYGKLGRSGLNSFKERQYSSDKHLTPALYHAFDMVQQLLALRPERLLPLAPMATHRFIAASDAAQDAPRQGSAGALLVTPDGKRRGLVVEVEDSMFQLWSEDEAKIAQLELMAVYMSLAYWAAHVRSLPGIWFIDNVAALMALIRGRSNNEELDKMAGAVHGLLFAISSPLYFEWVCSGDNWSDGISRNGMKDAWALDHRFTMTSLKPLLILLKLPYTCIVHVFRFI